MALKKLSELTTVASVVPSTDFIPVVIAGAPVTDGKILANNLLLTMLASAAETTTGTSTGKAVTPDGLAGSEYGVRAFSVQLFGSTVTPVVGDGCAYAGPIPTCMNGYNLIRVQLAVLVTSTVGTVTIQIARGRQPDATTVWTWVDILSTKLTIDVADYSSIYAGTPAVINAANDDWATGDMIRFDYDVIGTSVLGTWATLESRLP